MEQSPPDSAAVRKCARCGALLSATHPAAVCALCASGLGPAPEYQSPFTTAEDYDGADARGAAGTQEDLSGLRCPHCRSMLGYRDIGHGTCGVCGSGLGLDTLERSSFTLPPRPPGVLDVRVVDSETGVDEAPLWPPDAPIW